MSVPQDLQVQQKVERTRYHAVQRVWLLRSRPLLIFFLQEVLEPKQLLKSEELDTVGTVDSLWYTVYLVRQRPRR